ncbi:Fc.00g026840.m01.CDS01 [Cosmosporella sp. VM-42]
MTISLSSYFTSLLLVAGTIAPAAASQRDSSSDAGLEAWRAATDRTTSPQTCPSSCQDGDSDSGGLSSWFLFPDVASLATCNETMLLSFNIQKTVIDGKVAPVMAIRGCRADYSFSSEQQNSPMSKDDVAAVCSTPNHDIVKTSVTIGEPAGDTANSNKKASLDDLLLAGRQVQNYLSTKKPNCTENALTFGYSQSAVVGLFAGPEVYQHGVHADILSRFLQDAEEKNFSEARIAQLCPENGRGADYAVGIIAAPIDSLTLVQEVVRTWADGRCVSGNLENYMTVALRVPGLLQGSNNTSPSSSSSESSEEAHVWTRSRLAERATCKTTTVHSGDGCSAVAKRCGISQSNLTKYNPAKNFCTTLTPDQVVCCSSGTLPDPIPPANSDGTCKTKSVIGGDSCASMAKKCGLKPADFTKLHSSKDFCSKLVVGQPVCCTHGKLPDITPKPGKDGSCSVYTVKKDDGCATIAVSHGITVAKIEEFNKKTWGWNGCKLLYEKARICLSTGTPPFPVSISNAVCGPQVAGTKKPSSGSSDSWAKLNPCPLNVCCNIWGQCGTTDDFCVISKSATGAPGTSAPGKNGCISSCGRDIIKGSAPAKTMRVAYFESWNLNRKCLNMDVDQIDKSKYTHIHFAFANITSKYGVDISGAQDQFDLFKAMTGVKKIISFGGWDFSTKPGTFNILREATKAANRATFQSNIVAFIKKHNLDGVDIDWEYPGAPDIPDIPAGDANQGKDYYETLSGLKAILGSSKSVSLAAPASYWYLKAFPIKEIAAKIDYIIYMTYDLHGQWDYNNKWTSPGCPTGNCLRSHVNITETKDSLSMITKAGVPSNKVVVGITSYGRSFKMAQAGCTGPLCKFTGSARVSNAAKGRCTSTSGYISNAEINDIIDYGNVNKQWTDAGSNILVYNNTEWVAYMDDATKLDRAKLYASYNFAGTTDWAVDLEEFVDGSGADEGYDPTYVAAIDDDYYVKCNSKYNSLDQLKDRKSSITSYCMEQYIVDVEIKIMSDALDKYKDLIDNGYDDKFGIYEGYTIEQVPSQINAFMGNGHAGDFFTCAETGYRTCCSSCQYATCIENCDKSKDCKDGLGTHDTTCPTVYKDGSDGIDWYNTKVPNVTYTLNDSDGFYKAISKDYGVEKDWIKFGDVDVRVSNGCQYAGKDIKECQKKQDDWFWNYPEAADDIKVFNPKDVIGKSYDKSETLLSHLKLLRAIGSLDSQLNMADLVDASSLPALTMASAVDSMEKVVKEANEIKKKEREEMIANFIGGILFFIPFVGEAVEASMVAIRSALEMATVAGEAGLLAYSIVQDPDNAFMAVFSTLAGAGVSRGSWSKAANERRGMKNEDVKKLGSIKDDLDKINDCRGGMCKI